MLKFQEQCYRGEHDGSVGVLQEALLTGNDAQQGLVWFRLVESIPAKDGVEPHPKSDKGLVSSVGVNVQRVVALEQWPKLRQALLEAQSRSARKIVLNSIVDPMDLNQQESRILLLWDDTGRMSNEQASFLLRSWEEYSFQLQRDLQRGKTIEERNKQELLPDGSAVGLSCVLGDFGKMAQHYFEETKADRTLQIRNWGISPAVVQGVEQEPLNQVAPGNFHAAWIIEDNLNSNTKCITNLLQEPQKWEKHAYYIPSLLFIRPVNLSEVLPLLKQWVTNGGAFEVARQGAVEAQKKTWVHQYTWEAFERGFDRSEMNQMPERFSENYYVLQLMTPERERFKGVDVPFDSMDGNGRLNVALNPYETYEQLRESIDLGDPQCQWVVSSKIGWDDLAYYVQPEWFEFEAGRSILRWIFETKERASSVLNITSNQWDPLYNAVSSWLERKSLDTTIQQQKQENASENSASVTVQRRRL